MMWISRLLTAGLAVPLIVTTANAQVLLQEDFESYADTAAMMASWDSPSSGVTSQNGTLLPSPFGNPGQGAFHPGGNTMNKMFTPTAVTNQNYISWEFDLWDYADTVQPNGASRLTMALRNTGGSPPPAASAFLEVGIYNAQDPDPTSPSSIVSANGYAFRTVFVGGPTDTLLKPDLTAFGGSQGWIGFSQYNAGTGAYEALPRVLNAWHHFKIVLKETELTASLDLSSDGTIDGSWTVPLTANAGKLYNVARFGGPSNVSSLGASGLDNVLIQVVPEPATLGLLAVGSFVLLRRRRTA